MIVFLTDSEYKELQAIGVQERQARDLADMLVYDGMYHSTDMNDWSFYRLLQALKRYSLFSRLRDIAAMQDEAWWRKLEEQRRYSNYV